MSSLSLTTNKSKILRISRTLKKRELTMTNKKATSKNCNYSTLKMHLLAERYVSSFIKEKKRSRASKQNKNNKVRNGRL